MNPEKARSDAWVKVFSLCYEMGMEMADGATGVELVINFIRDLKTVVDAAVADYHADRDVIDVEINYYQDPDNNPSAYNTAVENQNKARAACIDAVIAFARSAHVQSRTPSLWHGTGLLTPNVIPDATDWKVAYEELATKYSELAAKVPGLASALDA